MKSLRSIDVDQVLAEAESVAATDAMGDGERKAKVIEMITTGDDTRLLETLHTFVQNIVIHLELEMPGHPGSKIDVKSITRQLKRQGTKYNDSRFRAFRRNFTNPSGGAHMFDLLHTIATGTKNMLVTEYLINVFVESLRLCPHTSVYMRWVRVLDGSWTQVNVVSNMSLPFGVDLTGVHREALKRKRANPKKDDLNPELSTTYNPKKFTGLIVKLRGCGGGDDVAKAKAVGRRRDNKATALVFQTGSMVLTGLQDIEQTRSSVRSLLPVLLRHVTAKRKKATLDEKQPQKKAKVN